MDEKLEKYILSISLPPETLVSELKILGVIAMGKYGIVYEALDTASRTVVALKEYFPVNLVKRESSQSISPIRPTDAAAFNSGKKKFLEKGLRISRINHPNVVRMTRVIEENNTVYLLMDKIDGTLLSKKMGPSSFIPPEMKNEWIERILDALGQIHRDGVLHLAVEPSNIIINEKGIPILIDFGYHEGEELEAKDNSVPYKPIEVVNGNLGQIEKCTDIYGAGSVFYHLLSGEAPILASARNNSKNDPQPKLTSFQSLKKDHSKTLLDSIDSAIAIKPEHRFRDIDEWQLAFSHEQESKLQNKKRIKYGLIYGSITLVAFWLFLGKNYYAENKLWDELSQSGNPCSAREYQEAYPAGKFSGQAKVKIDLCLEREASEAKQEEIERLERTRKIVGNFVRIEPGCFYMGSPAGEIGRNNNERLHEVCVDQPYELATTEVTIAQFNAFVNATGYKTDAERNVNDEGCWAIEPSNTEEPWLYRPWASWQSPFKGSGVNDSHPVVCVSPNDVNNFIAWINEISELSFRLPTEAEWEFAARGRGQRSVRPWGSSESEACQYSNVADTTNIPALTNLFGTPSPWPEYHNCTDEYLYSAPVKSFNPSFSGLYDLIGNVWEITCSAYSGSYGNMETECADFEENEPTLVDKGGSWESGPSSARSATRGQVPFYGRGSNIGFRLARPID